MRTDPDVLTLAQWMSPAFPVGAYCFSHGLEMAVHDGQVCNAKALSDWIETVVQSGSGRSDALFLAASYRALSSERVDEIDALCRAFAPSAERLLETTRQGAAFCQTVSALWDFDTRDLTYPVALGRAARLRGLDQILTAQFYLHAFMSNLVGAGMRMSVIGQTDGQQIIRDLTPLCPAIAEATKDGDLDALSGTAFLADISSMRHETQYSRVFRT